jgi:hypothetical protein
MLHLFLADSFSIVLQSYFRFIDNPLVTLGKFHTAESLSKRLLVLFPLAVP